MPFEYGGQTWPDTSVVTERFYVFFEEGGRSEEFPVVRYSLCLQTFREDAPEYSCIPVTDVQPMANGQLRGEVHAMREAETLTDAHLLATHRHEQLSLQEFLSLPPEERAAAEVHAAETLVSPDSNAIAMPLARPWSVPEPGVVLLLVLGILGLAVAGWRRKNQ